MKTKSALLLLVSIFLSTSIWAQWSTNGSSVYFNSGNVGLGTSSPGARISFSDVAANADGIAWHSESATLYGIYRTAGSWSGPNYQQLKLAFVTGIILEPGSDYGRSYVDIQGGGLRVTSGKVGIGTTAPGAPLHIGSGSASLHYGTQGVLIKPGDGNRALLELHSPDGLNRLVLQSLSGASYLASLDSKPLVLGANVGIGTENPGLPLHIMDPVNAGLYLDLTGGSKYYIASQSGNFLQFGLSGGGVAQSFVLKNGDVGIGTTTPDAKLSVKGQVHAQEVKVDLNGAVAPDYVFNKDYKLPSLEEIKSYIEKNNHLPEVPSAKQMEANGLNLGEMNLLLLKKVEKLTLLLIAESNSRGALAAEIEVLKKQLVLIQNR